MTLTQIVIVVLGVALVLFILIVILLMLFAKVGVNEADDDPLPVQRARPFTGRELAELRSTATPPAVVAGSDLDGIVLASEVEQACADHYCGVDIFAGAPREVTG